MQAIILKRLLFATGMLFSSSLALANTNLYIAADAGIFQADFDTRYRDTTDVIQQNIADSILQHGYTGGLAIGYKIACSANYLLNVEFAANFATEHANYQSGAATAAFSDSLEVRNFFDLTLVPAVMLSSTVTSYLKLGVSRALIENTLYSPAGFSPAMSYYHTNKKRIGFIAGIGVAKALSQHIAIFTEANYHDFGNVSMPNFTNFTATYTHSAHVYTYDFDVGVAYNF